MSDLNTLLTERIASAHTRIDGVEGRMTVVERDQATSGVRLQHIQSQLSEIRSGISKIGWLLVGGFVAAAIAFVVDGGLSGL